MASVLGLRCTTYLETALFTHGRPALLHSEKRGLARICRHYTLIIFAAERFRWAHSERLKKQPEDTAPTPESPISNSHKQFMAPPKAINIKGYLFAVRFPVRLQM
jgi:hypothetical protein